jgi:cysteine-rich repeat protein
VRQSLLVLVCAVGALGACTDQHVEYVKPLADVPDAARRDVGGADAPVDADAGDDAAADSDVDPVTDADAELDSETAPDAATDADAVVTPDAVPDSDTIADSDPPDANCVSESCNGLDDDCDGKTDEDFAGLGADCDANLDFCVLGKGVCSPDGTAVVCDEPPVTGANCDDGNACTADTSVFNTTTCTPSCQYAPITPCCGNSVVEDVEACDGNCPATCDDGDACTEDALVGKPSQCDVTCVATPAPGSSNDADGDALPDCQENADGLEWTDPLIHNGLQMIVGAAPDFALVWEGGCGSIPSNYGLMSASFEGSDQIASISAGWDYLASATSDYTDASYGFVPPFDDDSHVGSYGSFQVLLGGSFFLEAEARVCFSVDTGAGGLGNDDIAGRRNSCARVYVDPEAVSTPLAETGYQAGPSPGIGCTTLTAGTHRVAFMVRHNEAYTYAPRFSPRWCKAESANCEPDKKLTQLEFRSTDTPVDCEPVCGDNLCGPNLCGGFCGTCEAGEVCQSGACIVPCLPDCDGKECGDDGCGDTCGTCTEPALCTVDDLCEVPCTPTCDGKNCGGDGCGDTCGACQLGEVCTGGLCEVPCTPNCDAKNCGDNGCGGSCGTCGGGETCQSGICEGPAVCGDGNLVSSEFCDDGNTITEKLPTSNLTANACISDCSIAMKTCGNGIPEPELGEECDDGNAVDTDACDSSCIANTKTIGSACTVSGIDANEVDFTKGTITGCENVPAALGGCVRGCLRTIKPPIVSAVFNPGGYCTLIATSCSGTFCGLAPKMGTYATCTSCPAGTVLSTTTTAAAGTDVSSKSCLRICETQSDCRWRQNDPHDAAKSNPWRGYICTSIPGVASGEKVCTPAP